MIGKIVYFFFACIVLINVSNALEVDEKLTVRILEVSASKKTVLINRGVEDGLKIGDHAKFFLTTGVVARGVVVKTSPARSIWSLYRLNDTGSVNKDIAMNIKISTPVKLTEDISRSLKKNREEKKGFAYISPIPLAPGANDLDEDSGELSAVEGDGRMSQVLGPTKTIDFTKTLEVIGLLTIGSLSGTLVMDDASSASGGGTEVGFTIGIEKYFPQKASLFHNMSIQALLRKSLNGGDKTTTESADSTDYTINLGNSDVTEYGVRLHWHFLASPFAYQKPIGFVGVGGGLGSVSNTVLEEAISGSSNFVTFGGGVKYNLPNNIGLRGALDYYMRGENYSVSSEDSSGGTYTIKSNGVQIRAGVSYRW